MRASLNRPTLLAFVIALSACFLASARAMEYQSPQEIRQTAARFLEGLLENDDAIKRVQIGPIDSRLRLSLCGSPLVPFLPHGATPKGNITVGIRCSGSKPWKLYLSATVKTYREILVLTRGLPRHSQLSAEDVRLEQREITNINLPYLTEAEQAVGKYLTRSLPADYALNYEVLKDPVIVRRGERVILLYTSPGIEVRGSGTAIEDGSKGERISVRPDGASRVIEGVVLKPGLILVNQS